MIKVNKKINLAQLDSEYNKEGLIASLNELDEIVEIGLADKNSGNLQDLSDVIDKHIAKNPEIEAKLAKAALLAKLGITEDEAKLLLS